LAPLYFFPQEIPKMPFTITITEQNTATAANEFADAPGKEVFRQTVEALDLQAVFSAINKKPRKPRERKAKVTP
jgi:hypothetical protein